MNKLAGLALALVAAGVAAWIWLGDDDAGARGRAGGPERDAPVATGAGRPDAELSAPPAETGTAGADLAVASTPDDRTTVGAEEPEGPTALVTVIDDEGEPVRGARVSFVDLGTVSRERLIQESEENSSPEDMYERHGRWRTTGTDGLARFAYTGEGALVLAKEGDRKVGGILDPEAPPELELRLPRPSRVTAQVLRDGKPFGGVPVGLFIRSRDGGMGFDVMNQESGAKTGLVEFTGFRDLIRFTDDQELRYSVRLAYPGSGRPARKFDIDDPPENPIKLRMRDTAPIEVRVVDAEGELMDVEATVTVTDAGDDRGLDPRLTARLEGGTARFPFVGTKCTLDVEVAVVELGATWRVSHSDPRTPDELCTILVTPVERPSIVGRLRNADGTPATGTKGIWLLEVEGEENRRRESRRIAMDEEGWFRAEVEQLKPGDVVTVVAAHYGGPGVDARADGPGPFVLRDGENDVGDLLARETQGLISGRCVVASGEPLGEVIVSAQVSPAHSVAARAADDGTFTLYGMFEGPVEISVRSDEYVLAQPVVAQPGEKDVELVLVRGGEVIATLAEGSELESQSLSMVVIQDGEGRSRSGWSGFTEGVALAEGLSPGMHRVRVNYGSQVVLEVEDVAVSLENRTVDPRLQELDFDDLLRNVAITVVDVEGDPISSTWASVLVESRMVAGTSGRDGVIELTYIQQPELRVLVSAPGYRPALLEDVREDQRVVLEGGIPVTLRSQVRPPLEQDNQVASLSLVPLDLPAPVKPEHLVVTVPSDLATEGQARVTLPGPGRYRLSVTTTTKSSGMRIASAVPLDAADGADEDMPVVSVMESDANGIVPFDLPESLFD